MVRKAAPEEVVYCDRAQAVGLAVNLTCDAGTTSCTVGGSITLDLFQATKDANLFTVNLWAGLTFQGGVGFAKPARNLTQGRFEKLLKRHWLRSF